MNKPKVIIWGADNYNTLGMLRSLANHDFDIMVLLNGVKHGVTSSSKYCTDCRFVQSKKEAISFLLNQYDENSDPQQRAVLMPGGDSFSIACAENYDLLKTRFHLMCTRDPKVLISVTDKSVMSEVACKAGLLVPKAQVYSTQTTTFTVPFPVILKHIVTEGRVEFKTRTVKNPEELSKLKKYLNPHNTYLMQQFIPRSHDVVIYGCRLPNGKTVMAGHHTLERWSDDGGGSYGHLSPEIPEYLQPEALTKFLETVDYHGLFSAEYGYYDGQAYFYEVNFRNDGFCHLSFQAGANLPLLWVSECLNLGLKASPVMTKTVIGMNEIYDFANVIHGNISLARFKKDRREAEAFHFYDINDLKPYKNMRRNMVWEIPMRAVLKVLRPKIVWFLSKLHI